MSNWTHPKCEACWIADSATVDGSGYIESIRAPTRVVDPDLELCCFCGNPTLVGIYVRADRAELPLCPGHSDGIEEP